MAASFRASIGVLVPLLAGVSSLAAAGNGDKPRTPPTFDVGRCLTVVDRSAASTSTFEYGLPVEDVSPGSDELSDSRTHQFFALCRDSLPTPFPMWAYLDDAERAQAAGILGMVPPDGQILELAPGWRTGHDGGDGSCVHAITAVAMRRPISCAAASEPVTWDLAGVPEGAYVIRGHTLEPLPNLWTPRLGVVRIHDGDPDAVGPAVALMGPATTDEPIGTTSGATLRGCVSAAAGSTVTVSWARLLAPELWTEIETIEPLSPDCGFELAFVPPANVLGTEAIFKAEVVDRQARSFVAYATGTARIFDGDPGPLPEPTFYDFCGGPGDGAVPPLASCAIDPGETTGETGKGDESTGSTSGGDETTSTSSSSTTDGDGTGTSTTETGGSGTTATTGEGSEGSTTGSPRPLPPPGPPRTSCACATGTGTPWWWMPLLALLRRRGQPT